MDRKVLLYAADSGTAAGRSAYLLGCLYYGRDNRKEGIRYWEKAVCASPMMHQAHRALALALLEVYEDKAGARREMEKAFALEREQSKDAAPDGRYLLELLEIRKSCGVGAEELLALLERYPETVNRKEELAHQRLVLCNEAGKPEKAAEYITAANSTLIIPHSKTILINPEKKTISIMHKMQRLNSIPAVQQVF